MYVLFWPKTRSKNFQINRFTPLRSSAIGWRSPSNRISLESSASAPYEYAMRTRLASKAIQWEGSFYLYSRRPNFGNTATHWLSQSRDQILATALASDVNKHGSPSCSLSTPRCCLRAFVQRDDEEKASCCPVQTEKVETTQGTAERNLIQAFCFAKRCSASAGRTCGRTCDANANGSAYASRTFSGIAPTKFFMGI